MAWFKNVFGSAFFQKGMKSVPFVLLSILQFLLTVRSGVDHNYPLAENILYAVLQTLSLFVWSWLWLTLLQRITSPLPHKFRRGMRIVLNGGILVLYGLLLGFLFSQKDSLTFTILIKNGHDLLYPEAIRFMLSNFTPPIIAGLGFLLFLMIVGEIFLKLLSKPAIPAFRPFFFVAFVLLAVLHYFVLPNQQNEIGKLLYSMQRYYFQHDLNLEEEFNNSALFPLQQNVSADDEVNTASDSSRPNVFIVMLESYTSFYSGDHRENGKKVTPFLDSLAQSGFSAPHFFSNSIETSKGQFATLCSVIPAYRKNAFVDHIDKDFRCIPEIMNDNGYTSVLMKAYHDLSFENTGAFGKKIKFKYTYGMDERFFPPSFRKTHGFGWGVQDNFFYQKVFDILDSLREIPENEGQPMFVKTMSVSNHMNFVVPKEQRYIYPKPKNKHQHYINSLHLSDRYLREFFVQLQKRAHFRNSVVIVLGDNGNPIGPRYARFPTPLVITGPDIAKRKASERSFTQLDVAPTITSLLGINTTNHFAGTSMIRPQKPEFSPLVQPFHGTYLSSIIYPWRYIWHMSSGREQLYHLENDPKQKNNIINRPSTAPLDSLRRHVLRILWNEELLEQDRIFSHDTSSMQARFFFAEKHWDHDETVHFQFMSPAKVPYVLEIESVLFPLQQPDKKLSLLLHPGENSVPADSFYAGLNRITFYPASLENLDSAQARMNFPIFSTEIFLRSPHEELLSHLPRQGEQGWGDLGVDHGVERGPIMLQGREFSFGLGTHATSSWTIPLGGDWDYLSVVFGLQSDVRSCGDGASFEIRKDGKQAYMSQRLKQGDLDSVFIGVTGTQKIELKTLRGQSGSCDHTSWANPVLLRGEQYRSILNKLPAKPKVKLIRQVIEGPEPALFSVRAKNLKAPWKAGIRIIPLKSHRAQPSNLTPQNFSLPGKKILALPTTAFPPGISQVELTLSTDSLDFFRKSYWVLKLDSTTTPMDTLEWNGHQAWGSLHKNRSVLGKQLESNGSLFARGIGTHAPAEYGLKLPPGSQTLQFLTVRDGQRTCGDGFKIKVKHRDSILHQSGAILSNIHPQSIPVSGLDSIHLQFDMIGNKSCDAVDLLLPVLLH